MQVTIHYHNTDAGGVVYYANYLKFFEEGRTEFLANKGVSVKDMADNGTYFVITHQETDHKLPAFYGDVLTIKTKLLRMTAVRMEFEHQATNSRGELVCKGKAMTACVGRDWKPKAIPEEAAALLSKDLNG